MLVVPENRLRAADVHAQLAGFDAVVQLSTEHRQHHLASASLPVDVEVMREFTVATIAEHVCPPAVLHCVRRHVVRDDVEDLLEA